MKYILTNVVEERSIEVNEQCVERVISKYRLRDLVNRVNSTNESISMHFEGDWDLEITQ